MLPCLAPFDYKEAVRPDRSHSEEGHPHHLPLCTRHAVYKCHLPSWPAHHVRPQGPTCQKIIQIHNLTNLHPPCITFFPFSGISIYHSITSPLKISSHLHRKQKIPIYQSFFSHVLSHYQTSLFSISVFIVFLFLCVCLLSTILFSLWLLLSI